MLETLVVESCQEVGIHALSDGDLDRAEHRRVVDLGLFPWTTSCWRVLKSGRA